MITADNSALLESCVGETNGQFKMVASFSALKLCFVVNALNNKTKNPVHSCGITLILAMQLCQRPRLLSIRRYSARFRRMTVKLIFPRGRYDQSVTGSSKVQRLNPPISHRSRRFRAGSLQ